MRACYYLIWASWAAGHEVSTHTCRRLTYATDSQELVSACARLPVKTWRSNDGCRHVTGMPPTIIRTLTGEMWTEGGHLAIETRTMQLFAPDCTCSEAEACTLAHCLDGNSLWGERRRQHLAVPWGGSHVIRRRQPRQHFFRSY